MSGLEEEKLKRTVKLYAQAQLTLAMQKGKASRYFRLMYFSSNGITLFPINYCSLQVVFLCICTRNVSGQSVISLCFFPLRLILTPLIDSLNRLIKERRASRLSVCYISEPQLPSFQLQTNRKTNIAKGVSVCSPQGPRNHSENHKD